MLNIFKPLWKLKFVTAFSKSFRKEKIVNKCEIMTGQNLHEHPEQFLTNMAISISNLRGSFWIRSLESEVTLGVFQLASNLQMLASREPQGWSS